MSRKTLTITPTPYKSSRLAIPPSPFSPRLTRSPPLSSPTKSRPTSLNPTNTRAPQPTNTHLSSAPSKSTTKASILALTPPPQNPLNWLWKCHVCNRIYQLSVTRRCLDDGHYFCTGTTSVKRTRKTGKRVLRHKACASEFDYTGWKTWGTWRRGVEEKAGSAEMDLQQQDEGWRWRRSFQRVSSKFADVRRRPHAGKDCWNRCDYPSECRWGKQYGVHASVTHEAPPLPPPEKKEEKGKEYNKPKLQAGQDIPQSHTPPSIPKISFEDILSALSDTNTSPSDQEGTSPLLPIERILSIQNHNHNHSHDTQVESQNAAPAAHDTDTLVSPENPAAEPMPTPRDVYESAVRRKRRSSCGATPSPLGSHPASASAPAETRTGADLSGERGLGVSERKSGGEKREDGEEQAGGERSGSGEGATVSAAEMLRQAIDELELDIRRG